MEKRPKLSLVKNGAFSVHMKKINYFSLQPQAVSSDDNTGTQPLLTNRADSRLW